MNTNRIEKVSEIWMQINITSKPRIDWTPPAHLCFFIEMLLN